jgi:superfamily II DNA or RNA helicase
MPLYDFQEQVKNETYARWQEPDVFNVIASMATGGGKTVTFCQIVQDFNAPACIIAHRQELVSQASLALNRAGIQHDIIAQSATRQAIIRVHYDTDGDSHFRRGAPIRVAGVDTLLNHDLTDRWLSQVGLVVPDEGHHVQRENKWGKTIGMLPNARGFFPTAHPLRADGRGLGRNSDGLGDAIVVGPHARLLINRGFLTDYRLFCPSSDIDFHNLDVGPSGEYSAPKLQAVTHASNTIVGDVVKSYLKLAPGKLGVTFAVDVKGKNGAQAIAAAYNAAGVPAQVITANTPIAVRADYMRQFRARLLLQLVSVDCLGEGVDVPAIEVVSMVRKTASFQLYAQQFGRALRVMVGDEHQRNWGSYTDEQRLIVIANSAKPKAIIIDHVGNYAFHGLPDVPRTYSLDRAECRARPKAGPESLKACPQCTQAFERFLSTCPYCGFAPEPRGRGTPEQVEGDIIELSPEVLASLRGEIALLDGSAPDYGRDVVGNSVRKNHHNKQSAQLTLRGVMAIWAGWRFKLGENMKDANRRFWYTYGMDVLTAQTLGVKDAAELQARIQTELQQNYVEVRT